MPFFSIIIPLYNKENYIENTIKSVLNQRYTDFELLIINDCSTDSSLELVSRFDDPRLKIITHQKNKGLSASRNTGIKNASAHYIAFLDADDLWKADFLDEIYQLIHKYPEAALYATNYEEIIKKNVIVLPSNGSESLVLTTIIDNYFERSLKQPLYNQSSFCIKKEVFEKVGFYNETITYGEDVDFNIRAHLIYKLAFSNKPLSQYIISSENQITQSNFSSKTITDFDYYEKNNNNNSLKKFLDFQRYTKAKMYKLEGNFEKYYQLKKGIRLSNLNWKQIILLHLPSFILNEIKIWKQKKLSQGKRVTSYN